MTGARAKLKTYSHLAAGRRVPSEYELTTSRLLYYGSRGFEVETPAGRWIAEHQRASKLASSDWERFSDPRESTYRSYVARQATSEIFAERVLERIEKTGFDREIAPAWLARLTRAAFPLRHAFHGMEMIAAFVGAMAPSGKIAVMALLQAADERRRIERLSYRMALLARVHPSARGDTRPLWEHDDAYQPMREAIERALVTYDWGEALVALNVCLKPAIDAAFNGDLAGAASAHGDYLFAELCALLAEDSRWHEAWSGALVNALAEERASNAEAIAAWRAKWGEAAARAVGAYRTLLRRDAARP